MPPPIFLNDDSNKQDDILDYSKFNLDNINCNTGNHVDENDEIDACVDSTLLTAFEQNYSIPDSPFDDWQTDSSSSTANASTQGLRQRKLHRSKKSLMNLLSPYQQNMIQLTPKRPYQSNMVRHFPGAEYRTPEEQEKRRKNTEAARQSRHTAKQIEEQLEQNEINISNKNDEIRLEIATQIVHIKQLFVLLGLPSFDFETEWAFYLNSKYQGEMISEESDCENN